MILTTVVIPFNEQNTFFISSAVLRIMFSLFLFFPKTNIWGGFQEDIAPSLMAVGGNILDLGDQ